MESNRRKIAEDFFAEGYNCAQSVVLTFADLIGIEKDVLAKMSSSFGGGMGRLREVCGAVSGMFMVIGFLYGYDDPLAKDEKAEQYRKVQMLAEEFERKNSSIVCRKLLGLDVQREDYVPQERTAEYYKKRPCKSIVGDAAEILESFINENPIIK